MPVDTQLAPPADSYHVDSPHLGASKISDYLKCPAMYHKKYVEKLRLPGSPQAGLGICIHEVIRMGHNAGWGPEDAPQAAECLRVLWQQKQPYTSDPDHPEVAANLELACAKWLPWYLVWSSQQINVCVEERWLIETDGLVLEGTIDRVYRTNGQRILSDVKSGARKPSPAELGTDLQLSIYSYALRHLGLREDALELAWLRTGETLRTTRTDEYLAAVLEQTVVPVARAIGAGVFPCNPASKYGCSYCDFQAICEVGKGGE